MKLSIIILNYKKPQLTLACIDSLYKYFSNEFEKDQFELIIVDNHSEDDSLVLLENEKKQKKYANFKLVANNQNAGFSKGCNLGASKARGEYLLFLNNDTLIADKGILDMIKYLESNSAVGVLGGRLQNPDGSAQFSVGKFTTPIEVFFLLLGVQRFTRPANPKQVTPVDWVKGALFMIRKDIFEKLGGFDENIFMYTEDMELCYRVKKAGYGVAFFPHIRVIHDEHGSANRTFAIVNIYQNLLYFYKKHRSKKEYAFVKKLLRSKAFLLIGVGRMTHNKYLIQTYEKALTVA